MGDLLKGKVALVTGAAGRRGIGRATAIRLAREGADVVVVGRRMVPDVILEEDKQVGWRGLESVVEEIKALGRKALAIQADISKSKDVDDMVRRVIDTFGKIDILVNNASTPGQRDMPVVDLDEEIWTRIISVNLTGPFLVSRAVAKKMIEQGSGGKIVNVASKTGKIGKAGDSAYSAAKAGLINLTQAMGVELAPYKINVNAVCPSSTATDSRNQWAKEQAEAKGITADEVRAKHFAARGARIPLGRVAEAEDVANVIYFLVSPDSSFMTGEAVNVTGGEVIGH
jgi:NAD(P)-dependent dehydrogenase (short-subunit alcohol dehydrogenase family)